MWIANLSDGTVITEEDIPIEPGKLKPWRQLLQRLKDDGLKITGLRLGVGPALVNALPYKQCDGYWQAYEAIRYLFNSEVQRNREGIGSIVGDKVYITWMELGENGLTYIWQDVRSLEECLDASTLA